MKIIEKKTVEEILHPVKWIDAISQSFKMKRGTDYNMPLRNHIDINENTLLLMPCADKDYIATKLVTVFPGNPSKGMSPVQGTVVLQSAKDGSTLAIIDGTSLTAMRTAAVGSFGIRQLAPADAGRLGIIGAGKQGTHQCIFACAEKEISRIYVFDPDKNNIKNFVSNISLRYPGKEIIVASDAYDVCSHSDIIITATASEKPVLPDNRSLLLGKTIIGIGSYKPVMREFPDALYELADHIFIDTEDGLTESGDLIYPVEKGLMTREKIISAANIPPGLKNERATRVYKSVGMALFDLVAAKLVYEALD